MICLLSLSSFFFKFCVTVWMYLICFSSRPLICFWNLLIGRVQNWKCHNIHLGNVTTVIRVHSCTARSSYQRVFLSWSCVWWSVALSPHEVHLYPETKGINRANLLSLVDHHERGVKRIKCLWSDSERRASVLRWTDRMCSFQSVCSQRCKSEVGTSPVNFYVIPFYIWNSAQSLTSR